MWKQARLALGLLGFIGVGAAAGAGAAWLAIPTPQAYVEGDYSSYQIEAGEQVVLLGTESCPYCKKARAHLAERGVSFANIDVETSETGKAWMAKLEAQGVPVLLIGSRQIRGFNAESIDEAVAALN